MNQYQHPNHFVLHTERRARKVAKDKPFICPLCEKRRRRWAAHRRYCAVCEFERAVCEKRDQQAYIGIDRWITEERQRRKVDAERERRGPRRAK